MAQNAFIFDRPWAVGETAQYYLSTSKIPIYPQ